MSVELGKPSDYQPVEAVATAPARGWSSLAKASDTLPAGGQVPMSSSLIEDVNAAHTMALNIYNSQNPYDMTNQLQNPEPGLEENKYRAELIAHVEDKQRDKLHTLGSLALKAIESPRNPDLFPEEIFGKPGEGYIEQAKKIVEIDSPAAIVAAGQKFDQREADWMRRGEEQRAANRLVHDQERVAAGKPPLWSTNKPAPAPAHSQPPAQSDRRSIAWTPGRS